MRMLLGTTMLLIFATADRTPAQQSAVAILGDTIGTGRRGSPPVRDRACSASDAVRVIRAWFDAFNKGDTVALTKNTGSKSFTITTGGFAPTDTFVRLESTASLIAYAKARHRAHETMTLQSIQFFGWRAPNRLGFMPYYARRADDLGPAPLKGLGKAEFTCHEGVRFMNLALDRGVPRAGSRSGASQNQK